MRLLQKSLLTLSIIMISGAALADATITVIADNQNATLMIKNGKVLMKSDQLQDESIYDSTSDIFYVINHQKKTITPIDQDTVAKLSSTMGAAMSVVNKQLEGLSPEQRAQAEALMGSFGLTTTKPKAKPEVTLSATGSATYSDIPCEQSNILSDAQKIGTVCLSKGNSTPLSDTDYQTLLATQNFMLSMAKEAGEISQQFGGQSIPSFGDITLKSLVVHSTQIGDTNQGGGINVTSIKTGSLAQDIALPNDYQTEDVMAKMPQ